MSIKALSGDFAFYGVLDIMQRALAIVLVPVYTRVLSRNGYGDLDLIILVSTAILVLVDLQFVAGFERFYLAHYRAGNGPRFVGTNVLTRVALSVVAVAAFLVAGYAGALETRYIPSFLGHRTAWTLVASTIPLTLTYDVLLLQARMLRRKPWFFAGAVGNTFLTSVLCVVFTVAVPWGIVGVLLAQLIGKLCSTGVLLFGLRRDVSAHYDRDVLMLLLGYTLPLVPGWWLAFSSAYVSRFFVYGLRGAEENALLAISVKLVNIIGLFCTSYRTAFQPLAMSYIGDERGEQFYVRSLRLFTAGGIISTCALIALSKPALALLAPASYGVAGYYVPIFAVAAILAELEVNFQLGNQIARKTYWMSVGAAISFIATVVVLATFTGRLGIYAAGLSLLAAAVIRAVVTYVTAQRNHRIGYDRRSLLVFLGGCMAVLALSVMWATGAIHHAVFIAIVVLLGASLPWFVLAPAERQVVTGFVARALRRAAASR